MISALWLKLGGVVLAVALLAGIGFSIYSKGKAAGRVEGAAEQLDMDRKQFEQERAEFLKQLQHYQEQDDAAKARIAQKDSELSSLRARRVAAAESVRNLPDEKVVGDILERLGESPGATLSTPQLRRLDGILADSRNLQAQVAALEAKVAAQDQRIDAIAHQRDAAITAYNNLVPPYTNAYNAAQGKRFFLWRIPPFRWIVPQHRLDLPDPVTLKGLTP